MEEFNEDIPLRTECSQIFHSLHTVELWVVNGDMGGGGVEDGKLCSEYIA